MTQNTLKLLFKRAYDHRDAARERLRTADAGERGAAIEQDVRFILNFESFADVDRLMRTSNIELAEAIVANRPKSVRETATVVDRDYREVHRNLSNSNRWASSRSPRVGRRKSLFSGQELKPSTSRFSSRGWRARRRLRGIGLSPSVYSDGETVSSRTPKTAEAIDVFDHDD